MNSIACLDHCKTDHATGSVQHDSDVRVEKILSVRRRLGEGRYDVAEKLDVVVDRILEDLLHYSSFEEDCFLEFNHSRRFSPYHRGYSSPLIRPRA